MTDRFDVFVCKVQRPVATNDPTVPWLVYNKDRSVEVTIPDEKITKFVRDRMGGDYKAFWYCGRRGDEISFIRRAPEAFW